MRKKRSQEAASGNKPPRIICLEAETFLHFIFEVVIRGWFKEIDLVFTKTGIEAWHEIAVKKPDLFITNRIHPPGFDGIEILYELAKARADFPIVWTTGSPTVAENAEIFHLGLKSKVLPKPFKIEDLQEILNEFIGPCENPNPTLASQEWAKNHLETRINSAANS